MNNFLLQKTKVLLLNKFKLLPQIAIITGSGVKLFRDYKSPFSIRYNKLPFLRKQNGNPVKGHEGRLKLYKIKNKNVLVFSGRSHLYQDLSITDVATNVRLAYELGVKKIIVTNAAGGINKKFKTGDLMLITGFIDLMQSTERGVLNGITQPPSKIKSKLTSRLSALSSELHIKKGIYAGVLGPSYETLSEIKLLQLLGASAVGMSTISELICAKSLGMDYAGISIISNAWNQNHEPSHKEVLHNVKKANKKLDGLIVKLLDTIKT